MAIGYQAVSIDVDKAPSACSSDTLAACRMNVASTSVASEAEVPGTYSAYCDVIDIDPEEHDLEMQQAIIPVHQETFA